MVAELSALKQVIESLTGLNGLAVVIVQCVVTTIYTCKSYFRWGLRPSLGRRQSSNHFSQLLEDSRSLS